MMKRFVFLFLLLSVTSIFAQTAEIELFISAHQVEESSLDLPYTTENLTSEELLQNHFNGLPDALDSIPGFSSVYPFHSPMIYRGIRNFRLIFLEDGKRRMSAFNGGFLGQSIALFNVEKIELIKGSGSVIYGSGAMGGIINLVSKDLFDEEGLGGGILLSYGMNNAEIAQKYSLRYSDEGFASRLTFVSIGAADYRYGGGALATNSYYNQDAVLLQNGFRWNEQSTLYLNFQFDDIGPWGKPIGFDQSENLTYYENNQIYSIDSTFLSEQFGSLDRFKFIAFLEHESIDMYKLIRSSGTNSALNRNDTSFIYSGFTALSEINVGKHALTFGLDGIFSRRFDETTKIHFSSQTTNLSQTDDGAGAASIGIFSEDVLEVSEKFEITAGVRGDATFVTGGANPSTNLLLLPEVDNTDDQSKTALSGNIGFVFNPDDETAFSFHIGRAFRMPKANELFGMRQTAFGILLGNPNLKPEYSLNFDLGYRGSAKNLEWDIAVFSYFIENLINYVNETNIAGVNKVFQNVDKARIVGGEASISYDFYLSDTTTLVPSFGAAAYRGDDFSDSSLIRFWEAHDALYDICPPEVFVELRWLQDMGLKIRSSFSVVAEYHFEKKRAPESEYFLSFSSELTAGYALFDMKSSITFETEKYFDSVTLCLNIENLLNESYRPYLSYINGMGRNIEFLISIQ